MKLYFYIESMVSCITKSIIVHTMLFFVCCSVFANAGSVFGGSSWLRASDDEWSTSGQSDIRRLAEAADGGDVDAMRRLGILSMKGQKVKQSSKIAMQWWRKAADHGDGRSMMYLGDVYSSGNGVRKDIGRALRYYDEALASVGENTGDDLSGDNIVIKRIKKLPLDATFSWWEKRCRAGDANAMYYLGTLKKKARAGVLDDEKATAYLIQAAKAGHPKAKKKIEKAPRERYLAYWEEGITPDITTESEKEESENSVKQDIHGSKSLSQLQKSKTEELIKAAENGEYWKFEELIRQGADINYKDKKSPYSAFARAAIAACHDGDLEGLKILAQYNPDIYDCCSNDKMSVFSALRYSEAANVERVYYALLDLVDYSSLPKGKLSSLCADKRSPLAQAALSGYASCVEKMLMNGVSADDCQEGKTRPALHSMIHTMAVASSFRDFNADGFAKCFNLILAKADIDYIIIEDEGGRKRYKTPLVVALEYGLFPIATRLINEGADVNVCVYGQVNVLGMFLREKGPNSTIVQYLVGVGAHVENDPEAKKLLKNYEKAWYWYQKKHPKPGQTGGNHVQVR